MLNFRKAAFAVAMAAGVAGLTGGIGAQAQTIKAVMHSDVKILDPIWTTAYIQRNFGYMVWDTLFAFDEKFEVKPQMVDKWTVSDDKLTWTFTLRDGLEWSNGTPVTSEDCIASIKRWAARDSMGQKLIASVKSLEAVDAKTFKMNMKEPYGLVLQSLGKPSSNVPFMMPKKTADTDPMQQIKVEDVVGSGPFVFVASEWKPGEKIVFTKNAKYKPRSEPASGLAGGKVVKVDRVEWIAMPDVQTQVAALQNGEIDMIEAPSHDLLPLLGSDKNIKLFNGNPLGNQYVFRFNTLFKPFDNPKIRHAAMVAFNQEDFLKATIGDPQWYKVCKPVFVCGSPLASEDGMAGVLNRSMEQRANLVNAMPIATERGLSVSETHEKRSGHIDSIRLELDSDAGTTVVEGAVILGKPRLIMVDGIYCEATLNGHLLYLKNNDVPGVIGHVGNSLGKAGINIANFSLGRQETAVAGQPIQAIAVVEVDGEVTDEVQADLKSNPAILTVRPVEFLA